MKHFRPGQVVQVIPERPDGWKLRDWNVYAGSRGTVTQIFSPLQGAYTYRVMIAEGKLKGKSRWFKEDELIEAKELVEA